MSEKSPAVNFFPEGKGPTLVVEMPVLELLLVSFVVVVVVVEVFVLVADIVVVTSLAASDVDSAALLLSFELHPVASITTDASANTQIDGRFIYNPLPKAWKNVDASF